jgi:hypothetical protein
MTGYKKIFPGGVLLIALLSLPISASAQSVVAADELFLGFKIRLGGRYDNVRMSVGSPAGVKGGHAMDISFYVEVGVADNMSVSIDVPVIRPILFGVAFDMLQFEPEVTLLFARQTESKIDLVYGPSLGISLHYGPDYKSEEIGPDRGPSFFAVGPQIGGYFGMTFKGSSDVFNYQLGIHPYVTPLFPTDGEHDVGVAAGALLDNLFRFKI